LPVRVLPFKVIPIEQIIVQSATAAKMGYRAKTRKNVTSLPTMRTMCEPKNKIYRIEGMLVEENREMPAGKKKGSADVPVVPQCDDDG